MKEKIDNELVYREEANKILEEMQNVRPEMLNAEAKKLFEAIMKIADERDKSNEIISDLQNEVTIKDAKIDKKDKVIDMMAEEIKRIMQKVLSDGFQHDYTIENIIKYFYNKAQEN